ncbi:Hypothetical predicted protein [Olea europaea subsp. europaea]|uniref:Pentatricopeptide repeat-containing protein n=1 Tax=Olea europaea subsp. europaea TaxID=158383 RepID=A0A8S0RR06_OLEEU|nr:Hypothetical predicted protein [Olea europaea subsp. europaea]
MVFLTLEILVFHYSLFSSTCQFESNTSLRQNLKSWSAEKTTKDTLNFYLQVSQHFNDDGVENRFARVEDFLNESWKSLSCEYNVDDEKPTTLYDSIGSLIVNGDFEGHSHSNFSRKQNFIDEARSDAARILEILHQDGPGFNVKANLSDLGYVASGEIDKALEMLKEMISKGQLPNVLTYNFMIRGLCMVRKFEEARLMLKEMESKICEPNFLVYNGARLESYTRESPYSKAIELVKMSWY